MPTFSQLTPQYEVHQWTSGLTASDISSIVDPTNYFTWSIAADGSLHYENSFYGDNEIPLNSWIVSTPYWSATFTWNFPGSLTPSPSGSLTFTDEQFHEQFTPAS